MAPRMALVARRKDLEGLTLRDKAMRVARLQYWRLEQMADEMVAEAEERKQTTTSHTLPHQRKALGLRLS